MDPERQAFTKESGTSDATRNGHGLGSKKGGYGTLENEDDTAKKPVEESPFAKDQKRKRLILALSAHAVVLILGLRYTAPVWLPDIKDRLSLTQAQMSAVGWCLYAGSLVVGIPINRSLQRLVGKTAAFWIAACCAPLGYLYLHLAMVHQIKNVFVLYVVSVIVGYTTGGSYITILEILTERLGNDYLPILSGSTNLCYSLGGVTGCLGYMHNHNAETFLLSLSIIHFIAWIPVGITQYLRDRVIPKDTSGEKGIDKEAASEKKIDKKTPIDQETDGDDEAAVEQQKEAVKHSSIGSIEDMPMDDEKQLLRGREGMHLSVVEAYKKIIRIPSYYIVMLAMFLMYGIMTSIATNLGSLAKTIGADDKQVSRIYVTIERQTSIGNVKLFRFVCVCTG